MLNHPAHLGTTLFAHEPRARWRLPDRLREISGLAATSDGRIMGHDDERAVIYELDVVAGTIIKRFSVGDPAERGDFEGLAIGAGGVFYLVTSKGVVHRFEEGGDHASVAFETFDTGLAGECEVEGVAFDLKGERLILARKTNYSEEMRGRLALYAWSPLTPGERARPWLTVSVHALADALGTHAFHPSGMEIDDRSGRLILIASHERAMVELDADGRLLAARSLGRYHHQPEGVTILGDGALVIADEAHRGFPHIACYDRLAP